MSITSDLSQNAGIRTSFVVCPSYHGATLLALLLNNHSQISALGDTNPTREYDQTCACREPVSHCEFWSAIYQRLELERVSGSAYLPTLPWPLNGFHLEGNRVPMIQHPRLSHLAGSAAAGAADKVLPFLWPPHSRIVRRYVTLWEQFYALTSELHRTSMIVDGSKSSRKVSLLAQASKAICDLRVVHLVRDPRGFVASAQRYDPAAKLPTLAWLWSDAHRRMETLGRGLPYCRVRYEDLSEQPERIMDELLDFLHLPPERVVQPVRFPHKHHLMGNAMLFRFDGRITHDQRWRTELTPRAQEAVIAFTGGLSETYGYA